MEFENKKTGVLRVEGSKFYLSLRAERKDRKTDGHTERGAAGFLINDTALFKVGRGAETLHP